MTPTLQFQGTRLPLRSVTAANMLMARSPATPTQECPYAVWADLLVHSGFVLSKLGGKSHGKLNLSFAKACLDSVVTVVGRRRKRRRGRVSGCPNPHKPIEPFASL